MRSPVPAFVFASAAALAAAACNDGVAVTDPQVQPQILTAQGPANGVVTCDPAATGGTCPLKIAVTFRLAAGQFVSKAFVAFHGDGTDTGVEQGYSLPETFGNGDKPVTVAFQANIPPTILRKGALFTYTVRLVSGNGGESQASTLTVSVQ